MTFGLGNLFNYLGGIQLPRPTTVQFVTAMPFIWILQIACKYWTILSNNRLNVL